MKEQHLFAGADAWHHSRLILDRDPQGAMPTGGTVRLRLHVSSTLAAEAELSAALRLWTDAGEILINGEFTCDEKGGSFLFDAVMPGKPGLVWYYFILEQNGRRRYYGGSSGAGALYDNPPPAYQITVYDPAFDTPEWFRKGIMYQIFPDRFRRDGNLGGLPRLAYHRELGREPLAVEDWDAPVLYEALPGRPYYNPCDYYGGTLAGIAAALPYLKGLGGTCLYLNPVFDAAANHRYNTADYKRLDPVLGQEGDLRRLAECAKKYGMRLMLDGVFSHTGDDSVYFNRRASYEEPGAYQSQESPYYPWYTFDQWPEKYHSWWGFETLPEVNELNPEYIDFIANAEDSVLAHWAREGATSWRLDVADELPDEFIRILRKRLKELDPEGVLLGEVWEDATNKVSMGGRRGYANGDELDSVMNYPFFAAVSAFLLGREDAYQLHHRLSELREHFPKPMYYALMNLLGSHDTVRALTVLCGAPNRDTLTREQQAEIHFEGEELARGKARLRLAVLLQMTLPGVPCIYYGDEAGVTGMADPFNRTTYPWGHEDEDLLAWYRLMTRARSTQDALKCGKAVFSPLSHDVFAVLRGVEGGMDAFGNPAQDGSAIGLVNRAEQSAAVTFSTEDFKEGPDRINLASAYRDAVTGVRLTAKNGEYSLVLPPLSGILLVSEK